MLVPTALRQKPTADTKFFATTPIEIQYFMASGSILTADETIQSEISDNFGLEISSGYDLDVEVRSSKKSEPVRFTIEDIKVD